MIHCAGFTPIKFKPYNLRTNPRASHQTSPLYVGYEEGGGQIVKMESEHRFMQTLPVLP